MHVVKCEYQYFLLKFSLTLSDATLDKVLEPTATKKKKRRLLIF